MEFFRELGMPDEIVLPQVVLSGTTCLVVVSAALAAMLVLVSRWVVRATYAHAVAYRLRSEGRVPGYDSLWLDTQLQLGCVAGVWADVIL